MTHSGPALNLGLQRVYATPHYVINSPRVYWGLRAALNISTVPSVLNDLGGIRHSSLNLRIQQHNSNLKP